jgi:hypothetical protein
MIKYLSLITILALRLLYQPSVPQAYPAPFKAVPAIQPAPAPMPTIAPSHLLEFKGHVKNNKVFLIWAIGENETADLFEVEKSTDGVNFKMAALIFGTDKPATDSYEFYERAGNQKIKYRIKIVNKNKEAAYSPVVEIIPAA